MKKFILAVLVAVQPFAALAQNRGSGDAIFNEPAKAGGTQIFLGIVELFAAGYVYPGLTSEQQLVNAAEFELDVAQSLPMTEAERKQAVLAIRSNADNFLHSEDVGRISELKPYAANKLERIRTSQLVKKFEKDAAIEAAKVELATSRQSAVLAAQKLGYVDKSIRVIRVGGTILLATDVIARIYIWNAMEASPTLSPGVTYLQHLLVK